MSTLPDMAGMADLTLEEEEKLLEERGDALLRGDYDLADELAAKLPIPPAFVPLMTEYFGEEVVRERGISKLCSKR